MLTDREFHCLNDIIDKFFDDDDPMLGCHIVEKMARVRSMYLEESDDSMRMFRGVTNELFEARKKIQDLCKQVSNLQSQLDKLKNV